MIFQLPQEGNSRDRFQRLANFMLQFHPDWPRFPSPATYNAIASLKKEAHILLESQGIPETCIKKIWPADYQWFSENFGEYGCEFSFLRNYSFPPIAQNHLNRNRGDLPYFLIGYAWIDSPYLAYDYTLDCKNPRLVWVPSLDCSQCYRAADHLEQLLFACGFLNDAYYEYEWKVKCVFSKKFHPFQKLDLSSTCNLMDEQIGIALAKEFSHILRQHHFQPAWFSTYTDQFWLKGSTCFIVSRNNDPDDLYDLVEGWIGSHHLNEAEALISIMESNGFSCNILYS